jgi:hypothetical protein
LLFGQIDAELVLIWRGTPLGIHIPSIGFVAATDDAELAGDIELFGVGRIIGSRSI